MTIKEQRQVLADIDPYQDIREAVRDLCSNFPAEYFRKID